MVIDEMANSVIPSQLFQQAAAKGRRLYSALQARLHDSSRTDVQAASLDINHHLDSWEGQLDLSDSINQGLANENIERDAWTHVAVSSSPTSVSTAYPSFFGPAQGSLVCIP